MVNPDCQICLVLKKLYSGGQGCSPSSGYRVYSYRHTQICRYRGRDPFQNASDLINFFYELTNTYLKIFSYHYVKYRIFGGQFTFGYGREHQP